MKRSVFLIGSLLLLVFHVLPADQQFQPITPAQAHQEVPLFIGNTLNPLAFNLPITAREDTSQRSEKSAVFDVGNGKYAAVSDGRQMFAPDENGLLVPISEKGKKVGDAFVFDRLPEHVHITFDLTHPSYTLTQGTHSFTLAFTISGTGTIEDDHTIAYSLGDGVTLRWQVIGNQVQKKITIEKPGPLPDLSFTVSSSDNMTQSLAANSIHFTETASGKLLFKTEKPFLTDIAGKKLERSVTLQQKKAGIYTYDYDHTNLPYPYILDPSVGPNSPGTVVDDASTGNTAWTNASNAVALDGSYATITLSFPSNGLSHYLKATNFGFNIPSTNNIVGIIAETYASVDGGGDSFVDSVKIVKGGVISGTDKAPHYYVTNNAYQAYGGAADLWGVTLSTNDVNATNFGFVYGLSRDSVTPTISLDHMRMTVYYQAAPVPDLPWWSACILGTLFLPSALQKRTKETYTQLSA